MAKDTVICLVLQEQNIKPRGKYIKNTLFKKNRLWDKIILFLISLGRYAGGSEVAFLNFPHHILTAGDKFNKVTIVPGSGDAQ